MPKIELHTLSPSENVKHQIGLLSHANITDLHLFGVSPTNHMYAVYEMGIPAEIIQYLDRIGKFAEAPTEVVIAYEDETLERVLGFLLYLPVPSAPEACGVTYMAIEKLHRRRGLARAMMARVMERYPHIELTCPVAKVSFYESLGFQMIGVRQTQIRMNTRPYSCEGAMAIEDVSWIYESGQMQRLKADLLTKHGPKAMKAAQKQLLRHIANESRKAQTYFQVHSKR